MAPAGRDQQIIFVTGKGGVGKSSVAAAIAQKHAHQGRKALLVELGEQSYFQYVYGRPVVYEPTEIAPGFSVALWGGEACLREYVYHFIKVKKIVDLFFDNRVMRTFVKAAPALRELAVLGKITSGVRGWGPGLDFDVIVVDAFATGHFLALLKAPIGMGSLIESGPMGEQSRRIEAVLRDPAHTRYVIVTLPEELPVTETQELAVDLRQLMGQEAAVFCNRYYEAPLAVDDLSQATAVTQGAPQNPFVEFLKNLLVRQKAQFEKLKISIPAARSLPLVLSSKGVEVINEVERALP